jgi:hypothetical protein
VTRLGVAVNKYGNRKTVLDGITFDSVAEARRYQHLRLLERVGEISDLELQPVYVIEINGKVICRYYADFRYRTNGGETEVEDVKGVRTDVYRLKKKMVEAQYGIRITEVE